MDVLPPPIPSNTSTAAPALPPYAELVCRSNFSFLHGASHADELVARASRLGYSALAIADECSLSGIVRAHAAAKEHGLKLLIGARFRLSSDGAAAGAAFVVLARNFAGYGHLCELITLARGRAPKGEYHLTARDLDSPAASHAHLRGLPDCLVIYQPEHASPEDVLQAHAAWMSATFPGRAWIGLTLLLNATDDLHRAQVEAAAQAHRLRVVATGDVLMHARSRKPLLDVMTAMRIGKPVAECGYALAANAEQHLRTRLRLANLYSARLMAESTHIANLCTFSMDEIRMHYRYPEEDVPAGMTAAQYLRQETYAGAARRFPDGIPEKVRKQLDAELALIEEMQYEAYFLTVYELVRFARQENILCQGRGSAANSAVCYCLGVTEVDPARENLLFGRFLSKERGEPPDIDVDFEHQRREEVIQYIYTRYGRHRAALAAAISTFRPRGALRETGKALGVDASIIDRVARSHHWFDSRTDLLQRFAESGLDIDSPLIQRWAQMAAQLVRFPRHLSQHSGGFVIARDQLSRLVPIENAAMPDRSVIQWDKDDLEALGLLKVDVLALGMLTALRRALHLISAWRGQPFGMQDIPKEDPATYTMISKADTIGVFQIESRAQMTMLPRLRPERFYDLVIEVAIVRPGPIQGGMVHPYLRRRQGLEPISYPRPEIAEILTRTKGVPIFQEQAMQIAMVAAGYSAGEADELRRAMAAWKRKGGMDPHRERLISGMLNNGYPQEFAENLYRQIQGFGDYGFPESHAASFALLVYSSAWIKRHEPEAFLCALLNSQPMGFYSPSQLIQDARHHDVIVHGVDIRHSDWDSTLEPLAGTSRPAVRLGFSRLQGMRQDSAERIVSARAVRAFDNARDLARRARLDSHDLRVLAAGNALEPLAGHRRSALWEASGAMPDTDLLHVTDLREETPQLATPTEADEIIDDYHTMHLTLRRHPLALLRPLLTQRRFATAATLAGYRDGQLARACGMVTMRQRPQTAKGVIFMTLEDETGSVNVVIWPKVLERQRQEVLGAGLVGIYGKWQSHDNVRHLVAQYLVDLSPLLGRITVMSRDFH